MSVTVVSGWPELADSLRSRFVLPQLEQHLKRLTAAGTFTWAIVLHEEPNRDYANAVVLALPWIHDIEVPGVPGRLKTASQVLNPVHQLTVDDGPEALVVGIELAGSGMHWKAQDDATRNGLMELAERIQQRLAAINLGQR
ncbi:MAG: hypothetical protein ACKVT1_15175 [Dehalococcoidia bacterium]